MRHILRRLAARLWRPLFFAAWFYALSGLLPGRAYEAFLRPEFGLLLGLALLVLLALFLVEAGRRATAPRISLDGLIRMLLLLAPLAYFPIARGVSLDLVAALALAQATCSPSPTALAAALRSPASTSSSALLWLRLPTISPRRQLRKRPLIQHSRPRCSPA